ncbi:hypothetical protein FRC09_015741 [Ceratobasidium sp. 395]|nr:hypothetical protein FRC09_015741 [Ceratobasidium sp. 395]
MVRRSYVREQDAGELWARAVSVGYGGSVGQERGTRVPACRTTCLALIARTKKICAARSARKARRGTTRRDGRDGWEESSGTYPAKLCAGEEGVDDLVALTGMLVGVDACKIGQGSKRAGQYWQGRGVLRGHARRR